MGWRNISATVIKNGWTDVMTVSGVYCTRTCRSCVLRGTNNIPPYISPAKEGDDGQLHHDVVYLWTSCPQLWVLWLGLFRPKIQPQSKQSQAVRHWNKDRLLGKVPGGSSAPGRRTERGSKFCHRASVKSFMQAYLGDNCKCRGWSSPWTEPAGRNQRVGVCSLTMSSPGWTKQICNLPS